MNESEYQKQLAYLPKSHTLNLLRFAEAHSFPSLSLEELPLHHQYEEPTRFACGQLSNLIWECWENAKTKYNIEPKNLEWTPAERRKTSHLLLEDLILRGKYRGQYCKDIMDEIPNLDGHLSDTLELRLAFRADVWEEMRSLHLAQERSFSSFLLQLIDMYTFRVTKLKGSKKDSEE